MTGDEGEEPAMFVARIVPEPGTDLDALAAVVQRFLDTHIDALGIGGYIWDREAPILHTDDENDRVLLLDMRVQGCVNDEWFLVYLLRQLTCDHALCISVEDEDGAFLLIEAADELPKWVRPENATHRVWIQGGALHLIPPACAPLDTPLSLTAATDLVRDPAQHTRAPHEVEQAAFARLAAYPAQAIDHHHHTLAYLPITAAQLFALHPQWVSDAVHMLTTRDVVSTRRTQSHTYFPAALSDTTSSAPPPVLVRVRMTRHLYARLCMERFFPPTSYGRAWQRSVEQYRLAMSSQDARVSEHDLYHGRWLDLGAKLTSGLEMWAHHLQAHSLRQAPHRSFTPEERTRLVASLTRMGYFGNEIPGSAQWQALEAQALHVAAPPSESHARDLTEAWHCVQQVLQVPDDVRVDTLSPECDVAALHSHEDSDTWMSEAPDDVEALLSQPNAEDATMDKFQLFMNKMQTFIDSQGDMEGALFEDDDWDDTDSSDDEREQRMQRLVEPVPAHEWGAQNAAAASDPTPSAPRLAPERVAASSERAAARVAPPPSSQRLQGLSRLEPLEGDSDTDRESLLGDDDDAPAERAERHSLLDIQATPVPDDAEIVDGPGEQDMDDFLSFTRRTLGITEAQYADILKERRERGGTCRRLITAYVPPTIVPSDSKGPPLERLDAVLDAMERELAHARPEHMDEDAAPVLDDQDTELLQHLLASGMSLPDSLQRFATEYNVDEADATMLGDFLTSLSEQGDRPGPVGTLSARLGVGSLPRAAPP